MGEQDWLAERFEADRARLTAMAYRMLGSSSEADDAVQEAWIRSSRAGGRGVDNLRAWLSTIVARVCLNMLESRRARREDRLDVDGPDPIVVIDANEPEREVVLSDAIGLAMLIVLDRLTPAERVAFVLHDVFALPFDEIGRVVDRSPAAARQLASRARRRVQGASEPEADLQRQRLVADAFLAAARDGDLEALLQVLDPDVVLRADLGTVAPKRVIQGATAVAEQALAFARRYGQFTRRALVGGRVGLVAAEPGHVFSVLGLVVRRGKITEIEILAAPERLERLKVEGLDAGQ